MLSGFYTRPLGIPLVPSGFQCFKNHYVAKQHESVRDAMNFRDLKTEHKVHTETFYLVISV